MRARWERVLQPPAQIAPGCPILARPLRKGGNHTARTMSFAAGAPILAPFEKWLPDSAPRKAVHPIFCAMVIVEPSNFEGEFLHAEYATLGWYRIA